jgi:hypothetical protein
MLKKARDEATINAQRSSPHAHAIDGSAYDAVPRKVKQAVDDDAEEKAVAEAFSGHAERRSGRNR